MKRPVSKQFLIRPLYLQVYDTLIEKIQSGEWPPGKAIPNEIDLAQEFGVSVGTMRKALEEMVRNLMVERRQGRGTFICDQTSNEMQLRFTRLRDSNDEPFKGQIRNLEHAVGPADPADRSRLRLSESAQVIRVKRLRLNKGKPTMLENVTLPLSLFPSIDGDVASTTVGELAQINGIILGSAVESVGIAPACTQAASHLGVDPGSPLLQLDRVISTVDERPAEWRVALCRIDDVRYVVKMG